MNCRQNESANRSPVHLITGWIVFSIAYSAAVFYVGFFVL